MKKQSLQGKKILILGGANQHLKFVEAARRLGIYTINMSASRGFICLSAINCGRKEPLRSCAYAVLFGFARALQTVLNNYVPVAVSSLLAVIPYLAIIIVLLVVEIPNARRNNLRIFREI